MRATSGNKKKILARKAKDYFQVASVSLKAPTMPEKIAIGPDRLAYATEIEDTRPAADALKIGKQRAKYTPNAVARRRLSAPFSIRSCRSRVAVARDAPHRPSGLGPVPRHEL